MTFVPCLVRSIEGSEIVSITLGHPLVDDYLEFVGARGAVNTWLAVAYDLKVFFEVVAKEPAEVTAVDVFAFVAAQRAPRRGDRVVRIEDGEPGLAGRTIARRLSSVAGLFEYLLARGDAGVAVNPVPRGLAGRRAGRRGRGGVRLVRTPRTLPRVLSPSDVDRLLGALRTRRDRAMVLAMLLGGLRRCEVLGLRLADVSVGERRVHVWGKGGRERIVPVSGRFFAALGEYLELERPGHAPTDACFVVLKGPRRGLTLSASGLDEVLDGTRARAGLSKATCHQLRHTCLTRLREQGMALEAVQAQAGHASIESTRIYLHLSNDWLTRSWNTAIIRSLTLCAVDRWCRVLVGRRRAGLRIIVCRLTAPAAVGLDPFRADRERVTGRRGFAIVMLMARLGVRGGEVASRQIAMISWSMVRSMFVTVTVTPSTPVSKGTARCSSIIVNRPVICS